MGLFVILGICVGVYVLGTVLLAPLVWKWTGIFADYALDGTSSGGSVSYRNASDGRFLYSVLWGLGVLFLLVFGAVSLLRLLATAGTNLGMKLSGEQ